MFRNKASLYREFYFYLKRNKYYKQLPNAERTNIFILIDDEWRFHDILFLFLTFGRFCQVLTRMFLTDIRKMREVLPRIYDPLRVHGKRHPLKTAILKRTSDWNVKCNRSRQALLQLSALLAIYQTMIRIPKIPKGIWRALFHNSHHLAPRTRSLM